MIHPDTELRFINDKIGHGVVATKFIPKGTITWVLDKLDRVFTPDQIRQMDKMYQEVMDKYTYRNPEGNYVFCWDNARFINHSANANCITTAYEFEIAIRDIQPGEELTDDYGYLNLDEPFEVVPEPGSNRNVVYPDDLLRYYPVWDEKLLNAFPNLLQVNQPLFHILNKTVQQKATSIARGEKKMDSILNCYYKNGTVIEGMDVSLRSPKIAYPY
ncbi:SET domain-containing protein-lysine N-methyltransferase [Fulvivirgaceae bacterium PWU4]|uniref:SET domain-containing protein-lysine N-methyltransferase n=1 Tax=Chryseosolibacter histidini TaxID=2782349 RepID=A0AAP2DTT8_9BACT|nr:SET domain-containing protein [Chryseosolibacter histidini]MBT1700484.1 SET domain-containing protein-lysine N-methyltransferase [Chryseosolibacter histidini]